MYNRKWTLLYLLAFIIAKFYHNKLSHNQDFFIRIQCLTKYDTHVRVWQARDTFKYEMDTSKYYNNNVMIMYPLRRYYIIKFPVKSV